MTGAFTTPFTPQQEAIKELARFTPQQEAIKELASRELARRSLLHYTQRTVPKYLAGWVHEDMAMQLEWFLAELLAGRNPHMMILMPPRTGKTQMSGMTFPAWAIGRVPDLQFISCAYNVSLAGDFSKKVKEQLDSPEYKALFPHITPDPNNWSVESWSTINPEGQNAAYVAAGVGGGITGKGADCVVPYCGVNTPTGTIQASDIRVGDVIYGFNHKTSRVELATVVAVAAKERRKPLVRFGRAIVTEDHRVYTRDGYKRAFSTQGMSGLRLAESSPRRRVRGVFQESQLPEVCTTTLRPVRHGVRTPSLGAREVRTETRRGSSCVLSPWVLRRLQARQPGRLLEVPRGVRALRKEVGGEGAAEVLLPRVLHTIQAGAQRNRRVRREVFGAAERCSPQRQNLRAVRKIRGAYGNAPHKSRRVGQRVGQFGAALHEVPQHISFVRGTSAGTLATALLAEDYVVDIQTSTENFFVEGLLVHNCLYLDDPIKNAEEADSKDYLEKLWTWYGSTAYTRLSPRGGVLLVQTPWSDLDLAGRIQNEMAEAAKEGDADTPQFRVVKYKALAEEYEYRHAETREIIALPEPLHPDDAGAQHLALLREPGDALHPERYDRKRLLRIKKTLPKRFWSAQYQQNPVPDDGAYFTSSQFKRAALPEDRRHVRVVQAWDFAISEKQTNDFTVGTCTLQDDEDMIHVADVSRFRSGNSLEIVEKMLAFYKKWYHTNLIISVEDGQIWRSIKALFEKRCAELKLYPTVQVQRPITDKLARARPLQGRMEHGRVVFSAAESADGWYDTLRSEFLRFPAGAHDDIVDSLAWNVHTVISMPPPHKPKPKKPKSWRDELKTSSTSGSHMAA